MCVNGKFSGEAAREHTLARDFTSCLYDRYWVNISTNECRAFKTKMRVLETEYILLNEKKLREPYQENICCGCSH